MAELKIVKLHEMNDIKLGLRNDKLYFKDEVDAYVESILEKNKELENELATKKAEIAKKGMTICTLECNKRDLWLRFVQLRRALCRLRIGFALHFGTANSRKRIVPYWKHRCKTAPYWDSKAYKDIPQTPETANGTGFTKT